jgi:hypothetical protein
LLHEQKSRLRERQSQFCLVAHFSFFLMSYTVIGTDGKEYGPVAQEEVRRWIAEGRLNAQSMVKPESDAAFRPLSAFPEFATAFAPEAPQPSAPPVFPRSAGLPEGDYDLDIGACITAGWNVVKGHFWPCVGVTFLVMLTTSVINQVTGLFARPVIDGLIRHHRLSAGGIFILGSTSIIGAPVYVVLIAGLYLYFLKLIRGQSPTVGDAFSGFGPSLGQLILLGLVKGVLVLIGLAFCIIPGVYLSVAWVFATPLVIDRRMGFWDALELSRKTVSRHWFVVLGFLIVNSLLMMAGLIACCVGFFVTLPIGTAALLCAYESVFSQTRPASASGSSPSP